MSKKLIILVLVVAVAAAVAGFVLLSGGSQPPPAAPAGGNVPATGGQSESSVGGGTAAPPAPSAVTAPAGKASSAPVAAPPTPAVPAPSAPAVKNFTITANDSGADLTTVKVAKGDTVNITFTVQAQGTYHGGLDFRSSVVSSGPISPGSSKTVTFTAESYFSFIPYWPATNIEKPYSISVVVE